MELINKILYLPTLLIEILYISYRVITDEEVLIGIQVDIDSTVEELFEEMIVIFPNWFMVCFSVCSWAFIFKQIIF